MYIYIYIYIKSIGYGETISFTREFTKDNRDNSSLLRFHMSLCRTNADFLLNSKCII